MKDGGQILWNATAICEMSKTSWKMEKLLMKGDSVNHSKVQKFLLEHETSQDFTNWDRKFHLWKGDILVADLQEVEKIDASEIDPRRINAKDVLTPQR